MKDEKIVAGMLDIGEALLTPGAEVNRIEDTIIRIGEAYGFVRVDVLTITASIVLTVHTAQGESLTQTRRIRKTEINMERVDKLNALSRTICETKPELEYVEQHLELIRNTSHYSEAVMMLAYIMVAASFTVFFGGNAVDALISAISSILVRLLVRIGTRIRMNPIFQNMMCAAAAGLFVLALSKLGLQFNTDSIVIGNVMLLIPGLALTSALRDIIGGDLITGSLVMIEAVLKAVAIALGFAVLLIGG